MAESTKPGRRARRSTRVSRELEEARRRNAEQLAQQRDQERRVEDSLATFFDAGDQLVAAEQECRRRIEPHERAIAKLRGQLDLVVTEQETTQALAALAIHEADRTVEQVGELLRLGEKAARRLIAAGREAAAKDTTTDQTEDGAPPSNSAVDPVAGVRWEEPDGDDGPDAARAAAPTGAVAGVPGSEGRPPWTAGGRDVSAATSESDTVDA